MLTLVLLLSRVVGMPVRDSDGRVIGRLADLSVRLHTEPHVIGQFVIRRPRAGLLVVPKAAVDLHAGRLTLKAEIGDVSQYEVAHVSDALMPDAILLKRDVLDTQIVDVVGQRLARVADVLLARTPDGGLQTVGVEVGFSGVLRRLGIGGLRRGIGDDVVAWSDLHLTSDRGHQVQLATPRAAVHRLDARALAALVSRVDTDAATEILAAEEPALAADAVRHAHPDIGERLLRTMPAPLAAAIVAAMPTEHAGHWRDRLATRHNAGRRFLRSPVSARRHLNWPRT
jgi:sporulation protein YlmC with PRC-barrel domain